MIHASFQENRSTALFIWRRFILLAALLGLGPFLQIFATRSQSGGLLFGISTIRLVMAGVILLGSLLLFGLYWLSRQRGPRLHRWWDAWIARLDQPRVWAGWLIGSAVALFLSLMWLLLSFSPLDEFTRTIFMRLSPLALWIFTLSGLTGLYLLALRHTGPGLLALLPRSRTFYAVLLLLAGICLAWAWAARVVLPVEGARLGWNRQGAPVTESQLFLAWAAGMLMLAVLALFQRPRRPAWLARLRPGRFDLLAALLIWLAAVIVWQSTPLQPNWFLSEPVYPNFEYYPNSDARAYDVSAQTALIGVGYRFYDSPYVRRSLLALFITVLHLIGGQHYELVILLQILVLALLPVMVYFVANALHNRIAGVMAAVMVLLREGNAIRLATDVTTSHVKLLMADLPATLLTVVFALLLVRWLQRIEQQPWLALAAGGALGFSMLIRLETAVFGVAAALAATIILWSRRRFGLWLQSGLAALLGVVLVLSPWVWRNYRLTGEVFIDHPYFSMGLLIQRFNPSGLNAIGVPDAGEGFDQAPPDAPANTPAPPAPSAKVRPLVIAGDFSALTARPAAPRPDEPGPTPTPGVDGGLLERESDKALGAITQNPADYLAVAAGHILNSQMQSFLVLPTAYRGLDSAVGVIAHRSAAEYLAGCCSAEAYIRRLPYWRGWDGTFSPESSVLLAFNLAMLAAGVTLAWKRWGWAGLAPLLMGAIYLVFNGLLRNSGGRYVLPVDWISLVYFSAGLAHVSLGLVAYVSGRRYSQALPQEADASTVFPASQPLSVAAGWWRSPRFYSLALGLFLLACIVPLMEQIQPERYAPERQQQMLQSVLVSEQLDAGQRQNLETFLDQGAVVLSGRALYPRFFPPRVGDEVDPRHPFAPAPYPRLGFFLAGVTSTNMSIPLDKKPASFPNASDVLVIACPPRDVLAVARFANNGSLKFVLLRDPFPAGLACPLPVK